MATLHPPVLSFPLKTVGLGLSVLAFLALTGCHKKAEDDADAGTPPVTEDSGTPDPIVVTVEDGGGGPIDAGPRDCDPFGQTGCTSAKAKCGLVGNRFGCQVPGTVDELGTCAVTAAGDDCKSGLTCLQGKCVRQCDQARGASACPTSEACALRVTFNGGPPYGEIFDVCVSTASECDVLSQSCATTSNACFPTNAGNKCAAPGTTADKATCVYYNDCKKGSACYNIGAGFKCYQFCSVNNGPSDAGTADGGADAGSTPVVHCTSGSCVGFSPEPDGGRLDYGLCN